MPAIIGVLIRWLVPALLGGLRFVAGSIAVQVLVGLGVGVLTVVGVDVAFNWYIAQARNSLGGLPAELLGLLGYMRVGEAIGIVVAAIAARMSMTMVRNAAGVLAIKRFVKL